jgi:bifunctional DNA-binding transcriptional regulator/antitoxin component of YhaV-PrlF toxin-antitoxin module
MAICFTSCWRCSVSQTVKMSKIVRSLRGGQVTIPAAFRRELGIGDDTMLRMTLADGELRIKPVELSEPSKGSPGLRALYEYFAPVREEILARGISQEEVFADIDAAIAEVRAEQRAKHG